MECARTLPSTCRESDREELSQEEEVNFIEENLNYIEKFLNNVRNIEHRLPRGSKNLMQDFRDTWYTFLSLGVKSSSTTDEVSSNERSGAVPKLRATPPCETNNQGVNEYNRSFASDEVECSMLDMKRRAGSGENSSSSEEIVLRKKRNIKRKDYAKPHGLFEEWKSVLARLDSRKVPPLEKFDVDSRQHLKAYLRRFESFCEDNYRGGRDLWIGQLELNLKGEILEAFNSMKEVDDSYNDVKKKLCDWYEDMKELRREKNEKDFTRACWVKDEPMYLFCNRLERSYRLAYPRRKVNLSKTLINKFTNCVPNDFKKCPTYRPRGTRRENENQAASRPLHVHSPQNEESSQRASANPDAREPEFKSKAAAQETKLERQRRLNSDKGTLLLRNRFSRLVDEADQNEDINGNRGNVRSHVNSDRNHTTYDEWKSEPTRETTNPRHNSQQGEPVPAIEQPSDVHSNSTRGSELPMGDQSAPRCEGESQNLQTQQSV
ncbi:uncharacterized protein LOC125179080 [Hyalella azteca]|uniref:Uncharacterized protein LOC125179080 n=1 Tax=Hyalella azteca TaxID=294128 RepID=A0A979FVW6_HYAAZ|nr:uncharacterized protein LOC125179080 [Hyalella azteca]